MSSSIALAVKPQLWSHMKKKFEKNEIGKKNLCAIATKLLPKSQGGGILCMRAAYLDNLLELMRLKNIKVKFNKIHWRGKLLIVHKKWSRNHLISSCM